MTATTNAEIAYSALLTRIVGLEHPPGSHLSERTLADGLAMSKTPVREALARARQEGWVTASARSGYVVSTVTVGDVRDVFEAWEVLAEALGPVATRPGQPTGDPLGPVLADYQALTTGPGNSRLQGLLASVLLEARRILLLALQRDRVSVEAALRARASHELRDLRTTVLEVLTSNVELTPTGATR